jgi:hypothetical protein
MAMEGARELAWAVTRVGRAREGHDEFDRLVHEVAEAWRAIFPAKLGYQLDEERDATADAGPGAREVRLKVSRGDFVGSVELCCAPERATSSALVIRVVARADSREVEAARAAGQRALGWSTRLSTAAGVALSLGFCWLTIGVESAPLIVGLMLTVILGILIVGGYALGVRIGEDLADRFALVAERRAGDDPAMQADFKRWHSLARQLRVQRRALARGLAGTPFRRCG